MLPDVVWAVRAVEQEDRARLGGGEDIDLLQELELVAGDEVGARDEVGGADRIRTEAQVRRGQRSGLLGVVNEVALRVVRRLGADDLDGVFVGAHRSVRTESVEEGAHGVGAFGGEVLVPVQAGVGDVVVDADGEVVLRVRLGQLVKDALGHGRGEFLRGQTVAAADDDRELRERDAAGGERFGDGGDDVLIQRLAGRAGLFGAVEHGDLADRFGEGCQEGLSGKGAIEADFEQPELFTLGVEGVNGFLGRSGGQSPSG